MRTRSLKLLTAIATVMLVWVGGCEAKVAATVHSPPGYSPVDRYSSQRQPQLAELMLEARTPDTLPNFEFGALQARIQEATDEAVASSATLSVAILDRATHQLASNGNNQIAGIASVAKLFIADDLLLREFEGRATLSSADRLALDIMLQSSDDSVAEKFWDQDGGAAIITQIANRYRLTATKPPGDGRWWNTVSSATDLIHYYDMLLDGSGGLPPERARIIVNDLAQSTPTGVDGYPQHFGIPDSLYAEPVAVKQGWMCCIGSDWMHLSTGMIGTDRRYIMVIQSLQPSDDTTARQTITRAVKTIFPHGRI
ncbi:hypothetical protein MUBE_09565 [Mycobacterium uberis]|uniref:Lipoprotein LppW n=1 Tax=Mycobacterium uberis TaxID=2162698 RepID=A0A3E1HFZ4_9MYCO|nr:hypothetical protein [Mycobacterium uberis]RFD25362.1 hypothetical protein MUBE_09565 [Mycobacterium uberis]